MKRKQFVALFVAVHILFIFLQIHKHSHIIKQSYNKQKKEHTKQLLLKKKEALTHQLYACQNKTDIKDFAINQLHMKPIRLNQIKTITGEYNHGNQL